MNSLKPRRVTEWREKEVKREVNKCYEISLLTVKHRSHYTCYNKKYWNKEHTVIDKNVVYTV